MTSRLTVELAALSELSGALAGHGDDLEELLTKLDAGMKRFEKSWEGAARERFSAVFARWREASADLHGMLRDMHHVTHTAHGNYHATEQANRQIWGGR